MRGVGDYALLGTTLDDAIGEAFDKTAKLLGLGYPGGPQVEKEAARGNATRFALPRPMQGRPEPDFSLSGLKTALRLEAETIAPLSDQDVADLCASFQQAVVEVIHDRLRAGMKVFRVRHGTPTALVAAGGVAANEAIRKVLQRVAFEHGIKLVVPPAELCTDNGAMIAWAGAERLALGLTDPLDFAPRARWPLEEIAGPPQARQPRSSCRSRTPEADRMTFDRIAVLGGGAWGTALANVTARAGRAVTLWEHDAGERRAACAEAREPISARRADRGQHRGDARSRRKPRAPKRSCWWCRRRRCARSSRRWRRRSRRARRSSPAPRASSTAPASS